MHFSQYESNKFQTIILVNFDENLGHFCTRDILVFVAVSKLLFGFEFCHLISNGYFRPLLDVTLL